jgi:transposase
MKAYSQDLRDRVIDTYKEGTYTKMAIAKRFHLAYDTACSWIKRYLTTGDYSSKQGVGCGRKEKFTDKAAILTFIDEHPDANGIEIRDAVVPGLPMSTFYDTLARMGITYKKKSRSINNEARTNAKPLGNE